MTVNIATSLKLTELRTEYDVEADDGTHYAIEAEYVPGTANRRIYRVAGWPNREFDSLTAVLDAIRQQRTEVSR